MQTRKHSIVEVILNTASGFILSCLVWEFLVKPIWHIQTSHGENMQITLLFTVVSVARSYAWRRLFNNHSTKNKNKGMHHEDPTDRNHR